MLIDDCLKEESVRGHEVSIFGVKFKDAVVFVINEDSTNFHPNNIRIFDHNDHPVVSSESGCISQLMPFDNLSINFKDGIEWIITVPLEDDNLWIISTWIARFRDDNIFYRKHSAVISVNKKLDVSLIASMSPDGKAFPLHAVFEGNRRYFNDVVASFGVVDKFAQILSCKNVRVLDVDVPEKIQKKRIKKGKLPLISYKIIEINMTSGKPVSNINGGGWTNRIHLCRGHMAEYGPEFGKGLLFGKHSGRFWIPPHAKGDKMEGVVDKRYKVEP